MSGMDELSLIEEAFHDVILTRYLSAAGLTILIYDHLLSFADEVRLIWSAEYTSSKVLFLAMRYLVPGMMITETVQLAGLSNISLSDKFCKVWVTLSILVGWLTIAINNWLVLLRLWVLWDRDRIFIVCTLLLFLSAHAATLVLAWIGVARMIPTVFFAPFVKLCGFNAPSKLGVVWIPGVLFEFVTLVAMACKVRTRPQTLKTLQQDSFGYFIFLFALSLANMSVFLFARMTLIFSMLFLMWCFATTTTCRMILSLRRSSEHARLRHEADVSEASDDSHEQFAQGGHRQFIELGRLPRKAS